jgi:hypothetical protein
MAAGASVPSRTILPRRPSIGARIAPRCHRDYLGEILIALRNPNRSAPRLGYRCARGPEHHMSD